MRKGKIETIRGKKQGESGLDIREACQVAVMENREMQ